MKNLILSSVVLALVLSSKALAVGQFKNCRSEIAEDHFMVCEDGPCGVDREKLGEVVVSLRVQAADIASGNLLFTDMDGTKVSVDLICALTTVRRDANDMDCVTHRPANARLGKLTLNFNSLQAPYYVVLFSEFSNAPIGAFITDTDCN